MEANNASSGRKGVSIPISKKISLPPVSPFSSGEGLPYAPVNWPNEGDIWGWRVGRKFSSRGYFIVRYLIVPAHLEPPTHRARKALAGRPQVKRYLQERFPDADINSFFASFSWRIPIKKEFLPNKVKGTLLPPPGKTPMLGGKAVGGGRTNGKMKQKQAECGEGTRRSSRVVAPSKSPMNYEENTTIGLCSDSDETSMNALPKSVSADSQTPDACYLAYLESMNYQDNTAIDSCSDSDESNMNASPKSVSANSQTPDACYLAYLESIKAGDTNLENEYSESKKKVALEANINSESLVMEEIDEKISKLQARREQASIALVEINREIAEIKTKQRMVFDCLPKVVQEVQLAQAQSFEWELKKKAAEEKQASILEKFAPLKAFPFEHL